MARRIPAPTVTSRPKRIAPRHAPIAKRQGNGNPGSSAAIRPVGGTGRATMRPPSTSRAWAWPFWSPIIKRSGTRSTAWPIRRNWSSRCPTRAPARRDSCRRRVSPPARLRAKVSITRDGGLPSLYARLNRKISLLGFRCLNSESGCCFVRKLPGNDTCGQR